ncbi:MAG: hypothetical protein PSX81_02710 [bacterium]|nr:hypothetical protein [bacterium]
MNEQRFTQQQSQNALTAIATELQLSGRTDIATAITSGRKRAVENTHYFRKPVSTTAGDLTGTIKLVEETDVFAKGKISLSAGKLPSGTIMAITKIALEYSSHASDTDATTKVFNNNIFDAEAYAAGTVDLNSTETGNQLLGVSSRRVPIKLLNATFVLFHGTNPIAKGIVGDFFKVGEKDFSEGLGAENKSLFKTIQPLYVADDTAKFDLVIDMPSTGSAGSLIHYLGFKLFGMEIIDR